MQKGEIIFAVHAYQSDKNETLFDVVRFSPDQSIKYQIAKGATKEMVKAAIDTVLSTPSAIDSSYITHEV